MALTFGGIGVLMSGLQDSNKPTVIVAGFILLLDLIATTVSIVLTFGTSKLVERNNQKKERKLTALMVMSRTPSIPTLTMPRNWKKVINL